MRQMTRTMICSFMLLGFMVGTVVMAQSTSEEPKNLLTTEPLKVWLVGSAPVDLTYTITEPVAINIYARSLDTNQSPIDTTIEIIDPDGNRLDYNDDLDITVNSDAGFENFNLSTPGTYIFRLATFSPSSEGGVEVEFSVGESQGNSTDESVLLDTTTEIDGTQVGSFTFDGTEGETVIISAQAINPAAPDLDLKFVVYAPDNTVIARDDDTGAAYGLGDTDPRAEITLPSTGTYRVEVQSYFRTPGEIQVKVVKSE